VKTALITYYGESPLSLQMRRFKPGMSVRTRLDDILPDERRRYGDRFLVIGPDGLIINIGALVPDEVAKIVIGENPRIYPVPGFDVRIPPGYALDDSGGDPTVVSASAMAQKQAAASAKERPSKPAPDLKILRDEDDPADGKEIVVDRPVVPPEEAKIKVSIGDGPTLTDEKEPEEPKPAKKAAKKSAPKKPAKRKPAKNRKGRGGKKEPKKSKADDLMEMF